MVGNLSTSQKNEFILEFVNIVNNSISIDHKIRKEDGGLGNLDNAQLTHLYCNTTFKN